MSANLDAFTLSDLCDLGGVTQRTVRYYIAQGLLRSPAGAGPGARYDAAHLARIRLIRRLQRDHLPLAEIRKRLAALGDEEAIALAEAPAAPPSGSALDYIRSALSSRGVRPPVPPPAPAAPPPAGSPALFRSAVPMTRENPASPGMDRSGIAEESAPYGDLAATPERSQWERIALDPDIELHVRRPLARPQSRAVDRLLKAARQILKEDLP